MQKPKPLKLPLARVQKLFDPFIDNPWVEHYTPIKRRDIRQAIAEGRFQRKPTLHTRKCNIERIAWLAVNGWKGAIEIDVGVPPHGNGPEQLTDGWHRLAAAIYRQDATIKANVSGGLDHAFNLFGVNCSQF